MVDNRTLADDSIIDLDELLSPSESGERPEITETLREPENLICAIESLAELAKGSRLSEKFLEKTRPLTEYIGKKLHTDMVESVVLAVLIDCGCSPYEEANLGFVKHSIGLSGIRALMLESHVKSLMLKRILVPTAGFDSDLLLDKNIIDVLQTDSEYVPEDAKCNDTEEFLIRFDDLIGELFPLNSSFEKRYYLARLSQLIEGNSGLPFIRKVSGYDLPDLDKLILVQFCNIFVNDNIEQIESKHIKGFFEDRFSLKRYWDTFVHEDNVFFRSGLVENHNDNGLADSRSFRLTDKARCELLGDMGKKTAHSTRVMDGNNVIRARDIVSKNMFYNADELAQISRLTSLLSEENYAAIRSRLEENGMRKCFPVLFYGSPGTGKTETALQLARTTGRDILTVDISQIRSKWVGDSEKNIKQVFDCYNAIARDNDNAPILLFNEADAIIGRRSSAVDHAVDKMENSIQNIILQEMEHLDGILIATTNLTCNMDPAFERRFLYKIEFRRPTLEVRLDIWKSMMPKISDSVLADVASRYDFSGGQIENVARKSMIESLISGKVLTISDLEQFCRSESINDAQTGTRRRIGF